MTANKPVLPVASAVAVRMPHPADGVGRALRDANRAPCAVPDAMRALLAQLDTIAVRKN